MNAKHRQNSQPSTASQQSYGASARWPETVERRIGLDVQDGMMGVVIDGEEVDASSGATTSTAFNASDGDTAMHHPPRRARHRRLACGEARTVRLSRDRSRGYRRPDLLM